MGSPSFAVERAWRIQDVGRGVNLESKEDTRAEGEHGNGG